MGYGESKISEKLRSHWRPQVIQRVYGRSGSKLASPGSRKGNRMKARNFAPALLITLALFSIVSMAASGTEKIEDYFLIDELYGLKYIEQAVSLFGLKYTRQRYPDDLITLSNGMVFLRHGRAIKEDSMEFDDSKEVFQRIK